MAPQSMPTLITRQAPNIPACVTSCLLGSPIGSCASITDGACLCTSPTFIPAVGNCMNSNCTTIADLQAGYNYAVAYCSAFNVNLPATTITALPSATAAVPSSAASSIVPVAPVVLDNANFTRISIIMGTVCGVLLAMAIGLGIWNIRLRVLREREDAANKTWTGTTSHSKGSQLKSGITTAADADLPAIASTSRAKKFFSGFRGTTSAARAELSFAESSRGGITSTNGTTTLNSAGGMFRSKSPFTGNRKSDSAWDDRAQLTSHNFGSATADSSFMGTSTYQSSGIELDYVGTPLGVSINRDGYDSGEATGGTEGTFVVPVLGRLDEGGEAGEEEWDKTHAK